MVVGVGDEPEGEREGGQRQRPAVEVERGAPRGEPDVGETVVEVPAVGLVDRLAVLDSLGQHEARVEDRRGEHNQREGEAHQGVRLQGALHDDGPQQVPEQV